MLTGLLKNVTKVSGHRTWMKPSFCYEKQLFVFPVMKIILVLLLVCWARSTSTIWFMLAWGTLCVIPLHITDLSKLPNIKNQCSWSLLIVLLYHYSLQASFLGSCLPEAWGPESKSYLFEILWIWKWDVKAITKCNETLLNWSQQGRTYELFLVSLIC